MANPVIKVGSASGGVAEPNASGCGPTTAVKGTNNATSNGATPSVISLGGSPDLSGVVADHVIYLQTAAGRRFSKITAVDNTAKTVTIEDTITAGNCTNKSWAIGGVLASVFGTSGYALLINDGTSAGDAKGGWTVEFQSGHAETASTALIRTLGSNSAGRFVMKAVDGFASRPVITVTGSSGLQISCASALVRDLEIKQTTSAATYVVRLLGEGAELHNCRVYSTGATKAIYGIQAGSASRCVVSGCEVYDCQTGVFAAVGSVVNCDIYNCNTGNGVGIDFSSNTGQAHGNVVFDCTTGIQTTANPLVTMTHNVVDTCTTGIVWGCSIGGVSTFPGISHSNVLVNCTTGLHFSNASATETWAVFGFYSFWKNCAFYNNTNHLKYNSTTSNDVTPWDGFTALSADPFNVSTKTSRKTANDWSGGPLLRNQGFPQDTVGLLTATRSYTDLGIQRLESPPWGVSRQTVMLSQDQIEEYL